MSGPKPKLLYIASNGRSGSTLLEMLLNVSPHLWTLGEFHVLPWEIRENVKPCGCGARVADCELWGPIVAEHRPVLLLGSIDRFRRAYNVDHTLRMSELAALFRGCLMSNSNRRAKVLRYAEDNRIILEAVHRRAVELGRSSLDRFVDSSKSPYRLMWLAASDQFDLKVIHLVKDPRAFAYSLAKGTSGVSQAVRVARAAARWQVENRLFDALSQHYLSSGQLFRLRYERLADAPEETLRELAHWLEVPMWTGASATFRETNHGISGNAARFESRGIQLDEKWKRGLPVTLQRLAYCGGWQLAPKYGYQAL